MTLIKNTARVPEVSDDFHTLEVEDVTLIDGIKFGTQDVPETRVQVQLLVRTPGEPDESSNAFMSTSLGDKATLGGIARAILGAIPNEHTFDIACLIGGRFKHMVGHNDRGWPKLIPGTAAPEKPRKGDPEQPF